MDHKGNIGMIFSKRVYYTDRIGRPGISSCYFNDFYFKIIINCENKYKIMDGKIIFDEDYIYEKIKEYSENFSITHDNTYLILIVYGTYRCFYDFGKDIIDGIISEKSKYYDDGWLDVNEWAVKMIVE